LRLKGVLTDGQGKNRLWRGMDELRQTLDRTQEKVFKYRTDWYLGRGFTIQERVSLTDYENPRRNTTGQGKSGQKKKRD